MDSTERKPIVSIIVAASQNGVIGKNGSMPWRLPGDLKYFKNTTMGKPVIMGSKTWLSLKKRPLPGRLNIVVTKQTQIEALGASVAPSLDEALKLAEQEAVTQKLSEIFIIGGGSVFEQTMPYVDRIYMTEILSNIDGDTFFNFPLDVAKWQKTIVAEPLKSEQDSHDYRFVLYEKKQ